MYHPRLQGSHYEMGFKYGSLLYKKGVRLDNNITINDDQFDFGLKSLSIISLHYPEIIDEIKGMAEGSHVEFEKLACFLLNIGVYGEAYGCTCLCLKKDDEIIFARNHDMFSKFKKTTESCLYRPSTGYTFIGQSDILIGKEDGVNEYGLAVGMTFVAAREPQPGINFPFIVRLLLEKTKSVAESIQLLQTLPFSTSQNIILADKHGNMTVVECSSQGMAVRQPQDNQDFILATNHFIDPSMSPMDNRPEHDWYLTQTRYESVLKTLLMTHDYDALQLAQNILSGKYGFVCQYKREWQFESLWSFVVRLNDLKIFRTEGNPSKSTFIEDSRLTWAIRKK